MFEQNADISGDWQGTLVDGRGYRFILKIARSDNGAWEGDFYSIDQEPGPTPVSYITLRGSDFEFAIDSWHCSYAGKIAVDGTSITGSWKDRKHLPLDFRRATKETAWPIDSSPHATQFVTVDSDVNLEVLDWGGSGRPLVLLAGMGNTAHAFDRFAPKLTATYHVYGITRRGFGGSSKPPTTHGNYEADRLGDDVLAVIDSLKINRPVLAGHSIAGVELSSIGTRHPEKVAGLVYLDAGYGYAYYNRPHGYWLLELLDLQEKLEKLIPGSGPYDQRQLIQELLQTSLPQFEKGLRERQEDLNALPFHPFDAEPIPCAIRAGLRKYTDIRAPILAIFAVPKDFGSFFEANPTAKAAAEARDLVSTSTQAEALENGLPSARVVRLPHADHYVFESNEADVLREMDAFIGNLS